MHSSSRFLSCWRLTEVPLADGKEQSWIMRRFSFLDPSSFIVGWMATPSGVRFRSAILRIMLMGMGTTQPWLISFCVFVSRAMVFSKIRAERWLPRFSIAMICSSLVLSQGRSRSGYVQPHVKMSWTIFQSFLNFHNCSNASM